MRRAREDRAGWRGRLAVGLVGLGALAFAAPAQAHPERPSYWPDPAPDTSVKPAAGGAVPSARSLRSALKTPRRTKVVCQGRKGKASMKRVRRSVRQARRGGYVLRPSQGRVKLTKKQGKRLRKINRKLAKRCKFRSVQAAINKSRNNGRVVIMPGRYLEPRSRSQPTNDQRCAELTQSDAQGEPVPSYRYQVTCPHDQNLIYVQGRRLAGGPPDPPLDDRHGLPDEGSCVRCNLQVEGSGVKPEDVILDAGTGYTGKAPQAKPADHAKHVVLRADRADGFVGRNFLMRGGREHGFYTEETDGVLLDRTKFYWNADYGHLSFHTDHHVVQNCDGFGSGDAVVYPGAAPETGSQARLDFYPDASRFNTVIRNCDLRHSVFAYSGSMGNAVRITNNHVYGTSGGIATDSLSTAGHPGYPADSVQIDNNLIYSNNLNLYRPNPPIEPLFSRAAVGTGITWAGHNDGVVRDNWIFDNWRQGAILFGIPEAFVDPEGDVNPGISCPDPELQATSCGNRYFDNKLGVAPPGFEMPPGVTAFGNEVGGDGGVLPNGVDFWWDEAEVNTGNCWFDNTGPDGTPATVEGNPVDLPSDCETSVGAGNEAKINQLILCSVDPANPGCGWHVTPPKP